MSTYSLNARRNVFISFIPLRYTCYYDLPFQLKLRFKFHSQSLIQDLALNPSSSPDAL